MNVSRLPNTSLLAPLIVALTVALAVGCGELDPPGHGGDGGTGGGASSSQSGASSSSSGATGSGGPSSGGSVTGSEGTSSGDETGGPSTATSTSTSTATSTETGGEGSGSSSSGGDSESSGGPGGAEGCVHPKAWWDWEGWPAVALWGSGPDDVWAVSPKVGPMVGAVRRFDGVTWQAVDLGIPAFIPVSVTGSGADDLYIAASDGRVARYDGAWQLDGEVMGAPVLAATGPGTLVAVGVGDTVMVRAEGLWQPQILPLKASLRGAAGSAPDHVFAVGDGGTVLHSDGVEWSVLASPTTASLRGVAMLNEESAVAGGDGGVILRLDTDGITSIEPFPAPYTKLGVRGVWATDVDRIFAISVQSLHYFDGEAWSARSLPFFDGAAAVWAASAQQIHIGGLQHASLHCRALP